MKNETEMEAYLRPFSFDLPAELIADRPAEKRDASRLLLVDRTRGSFHDYLFSDLPDLLRSGDLLVQNTTRVSCRRVFLRRSTGARCETIFLEPAGGPAGSTPATHNCLVKNARKLREGEVLLSPDPATNFRFSRETAEADGEDPGAENEPAGIFRLTALNAAGAPAWPTAAAAEDFFAHHGNVPLPPYLKREAAEEDRERYQTVYAGRPGSVAAPTAGLHFTPALLEELAARSIQFARLELLISYGTFAPLSPSNFNENALHPETYSIPEDFPLDAFRARTQAEAGRNIAVGTTSLRALEDNLRKFGELRPGVFETRLFLKPAGWRDRPGDVCESAAGLLTNFHLPASSLLLLAATFGGTDLILAAYEHAIAERYRFYSYGDAMLIL